MFRTSFEILIGYDLQLLNGIYSCHGLDDLSDMLERGHCSKSLGRIKKANLPFFQIVSNNTFYCPRRFEVMRKCTKSKDRISYTDRKKLTAAALGSINRADASAKMTGFSPSATRVSICPSTHAFLPSTLVVFALKTT